MERKIGEQFYIDGKQYEIIEDKTDSCKNCCFNNTSCFELIKEHIGYCSNVFRKDKKNISVKRLKKIM